MALSAPGWSRVLELGYPRQSGLLRARPGAIVHFGAVGSLAVIGPLGGIAIGERLSALHGRALHGRRIRFDRGATLAHPYARYAHGGAGGHYKRQQGNLLDAAQQADGGFRVHRQGSVAGRHFYYVRVRQDDEMIAWSSPMFINYSRRRLPKPWSGLLAYWWRGRSRRRKPPSSDDLCVSARIGCVNQSHLIATAGSTRVARRAGTTIAASATANSIVLQASSVNGSFGVTAKSTASSDRAIASVIVKPRRTPAATTRAPCRS